MNSIILNSLSALCSHQLYQIRKYFYTFMRVVLTIYGNFQYGGLYYVIENDYI